MKPNTDIRDALFDTFIELVKADSSTIILVNDQSAFSLESFKKDYPDRYINVGIAEQNIINVAAGLSQSGMKAYAYGITNFMSLRCAEQIMVNLCCLNLPVTIIASGGGLTYASDGPTHHSTLDISVLRGMPNLAIYNPSDGLSTRCSLLEAHYFNVPSYIRLEKGILPVIHSSEFDLKEGFREVKKAEDTVIVSTGHIGHVAVELCDLLNESGHKTGHIDVVRLKPINSISLLETLGKYKRIFVIEEQVPSGGLSDLIARIIIESGEKIPMKGITLPEEPIYSYGSRDWLREKYKLSAKALHQTILNIVHEKA